MRVFSSFMDVGKEGGMRINLSLKAGRGRIRDVSMYDRERLKQGIDYHFENILDICSNAHQTGGLQAAYIYHCHRGLYQCKFKKLGVAST